MHESWMDSFLHMQSVSVNSFFFPLAVQCAISYTTFDLLSVYFCHAFNNFPYILFSFEVDTTWIHFPSPFDLQFNFRFSPHFRIGSNLWIISLCYKLMRKHPSLSSITVWIIIVRVWFHFSLNQCSNPKEFHAIVWTIAMNDDLWRLPTPPPAGCIIIM